VPLLTTALLTTALLTTALLTHSHRSRVLARRAHHGAALACCPAAVCALARRLLVQLLQTGAGWKAMPNVVGAIRNLCQNSTANKDAVREAGGIAGLVELLKAGEISSAAVKAAETLEV
jgi:hypothetical protein